MSTLGLILICIVSSALLGLFFELLWAVTAFDDYNIKYACIITAALSVFSVAFVLLLCPDSPEVEVQTIDKRYNEVLLEEDFEHYKAVNKEDIKRFQEAYVDKCVKFNEEQKNYMLHAYCVIGYTYIREKQKKDPKYGHDYGLVCIGDGALETETYKKFVEFAPRFTKFQVEDNTVLVFSFDEEVPNPECTCGRCKKTITNIFRLTQISKQ